MQNDSSELITNNLEKALLTLRILRKLTVSGFYKPHTNQDCMSFLKVIFDRAKTSLEYRKFRISCKKHQVLLMILKLKFRLEVNAVESL